jgi:hypothetical protein
MESALLDTDTLSEIMKGVDPQVQDNARRYLAIFHHLTFSIITRYEILHIPPNLVVKRVTAHRKPPEVRIWRLRNQSRVGTVPPSTSTPHCPACWARRW